MSIEETAREYIRLRRLRLQMRAERFRLMNLCQETDWPENEPFGRMGFSECLQGWDDHRDEPLEGWDQAVAICTSNSGCVHCNVAYLAHESYRRTANTSGTALRRLEREVNR